jgi:hypothetical protein
MNYLNPNSVLYWIGVLFLNLKDGLSFAERPDNNPGYNTKYNKKTNN